MALFNVLFDIAARTAKFEEAMTRVDRRLDGMQRGAAKLTKGLAGVFATGLIARWASKMIEVGDRLADMSKKTGVTVENLSRLQYVAERGGTTLEALTGAGQRLAKSLGTVGDEGKQVQRALKDLNLSASELRSVSPDKQLLLMADAMGKVTNPTDRARIAITLLGRSGAELLPVLHDGADGIRALMEEADRLGITISTRTAEQLAELDDQFTKLKGQARGAGVELMALASGPLTFLAEKLAEGARGWQVMFGATGDPLEETNKQIADLQTELNKLVDAQRHWDKSDRTAQRVAHLKELLEVLRQTQEQILAQPRAQERYNALIAEQTRKEEEAAAAEADRLEQRQKAAEEAAKPLAKYKAELAEIIALEKRNNELELKFPTGLLDKDDLQRVLDSTGKMIEEQAEKDEKVFAKLYDDVKRTFKNDWEEMTVYAEQAARNIQDTLADFLFDPFDKGLKGMLRGFVDVLRRMVAEMAAAQIAKPLQGFLGSLVGGLFMGGGAAAAAPGAGAFSAGAGGMGPYLARASGGPVSAGRSYMVGEKGPERFVPKVDGQIIPNGGGNMTFAPVTNVHVDSRSDRALVQRDIEATVGRINREAFAEYRNMQKRR